MITMEEPSQVLHYFLYMVILVYALTVSQQLVVFNALLLIRTVLEIYVIVKHVEATTDTSLY